MFITEYTRISLQCVKFSSILRDGDSTNISLFALYCLVVVNIDKRSGKNLCLNVLSVKSVCWRRPPNVKYTLV